MNGKRYLDEMVQERRMSTNNEERYDLFSSLLDANEGQLEGDAKLSDKALLGACGATDTLTVFN